MKIEDKECAGCGDLEYRHGWVRAKKTGCRGFLRKDGRTVGKDGRVVEQIGQRATKGKWRWSNDT